MTNKKDIIIKIISYLILILASIITLFPFYILIITSFKSNSELISNVYTFFPKNITFDNYTQIFSESMVDYFGSIPKGFFNTLLIVMPTSTIGVIISGMSAYSFAKINFRFKNQLFGIVIFMMLIPGTITISTQYLLFDTIGWVGSMKPLIVPALFGSASTVFFLRQYIRGIPSELCEAASVDGLNKFSTYFLIILPVSLPAMSAQFILLFICGYNDYLAPLLYLITPSKYTLQVVLQQFNSPEVSYWTRMCASAVVGMLPLIIVFIFAQKYIINGVTVGSIK